MRSEAVVSAAAAVALVLAGCAPTDSRESADVPTGPSPTVVGVPATSTPPTTANPVTPAPSVTPTGPQAYELLLVDGTYTTPRICQAYRSKIAKYAGAATGRLAGGKNKTRNAYDAFDYRKTHAWVKDPMGARFETSMDASATWALNQLTGGRAAEARSLTDYRRDSIDACGLTGALRSAKTKVASADRLGRRIVSKARTRPWYPRGYFLIGDDLAGRWVNGASAPCSYGCGYWTLDVYSARGCPSGVYVQIDIRRFGTTVDWDNDTLGYLAPRRSGRMQFWTYLSGSHTGSITQARCY